MSDRPVKILHLTQALSLGGANRAIFAAAKYSAQQGAFQHSVVPLIPGVPPGVAELAQESGATLLHDSSEPALMRAIEECDLLQVSWWNNPEMADFLRKPLPATRVLSWLHVGGDRAPQVVTPEIIEFSDIAAATSPHCLQCQTITKLPEDVRRSKCILVYGAADFARVAGCTPQAHPGFNVGYIGTIDFGKLYRRYIPMSAAVAIPDVRFIVCGNGMVPALMEEARAIQAENKFLFTGYVEDIKQVLQLLDVYGLPLCEETYASSELNLQEAMYCGVPPVAFSHGGVKLLIQHEQTGLLVATEKEYQEALQHLYHNPAERHRLSENAKQYARSVFGAENAARELNKIYAQLVTKPKVSRQWPQKSAVSIVELPLTFPQSNSKAFFGMNSFVQSLGEEGVTYLRSARAPLLDERLAADLKILQASPLMKMSGILSYSDFYKEDRYLYFWAGLAKLSNRNYAEALVSLDQAVLYGFDDYRIWGYIALCAQTLGIQDFTKQAWEALYQIAPAQDHQKLRSFFEQVKI